jgi:hypothetical protein
MTKLNNGQMVTDIDATDDNAALTTQGYSIHHIETWHEFETACIVWDAPEITDTDCPF